MAIKWRAAFAFLQRRKRSYQLCFGSPSGNEVLIDLSKFCRAVESCVVPGNADKTLILEGRREVWLRITNHQHLTTEQLYALYDGRNIQVNPQEDDDNG